MNGTDDVGWLTGMRIVTSVLMTRAEGRVVRRTWSERLRTWPWVPWVSTRTERVEVPRDDVLRVDARTLMMHPVTYRKLRQRTTKPDAV